jgi:glycosyltransferase involved in cell wall biosynthesis
LRILFLHEVNYLTKPIFEMHEFPEHLAEKGHEVGFVQFPEGLTKVQLRNTPFKQAIAGRIVKDTELTLFTPRTGSGGLLGRLATVFTFGGQFKRIIQDFRPDVIVSFAVPTSGWQALRVAKKSGTPFVFRALDVSHKIRKSEFSNLISLAERFIYRTADWVSANNPAMLEYTLNSGADNSRSSVNFPPLDLNHFASIGNERKLTIRTSLGISASSKVLLYMGSFFYFSGLPEVIKEFAASAKADEFLVLVGAGDQGEELRDLVSELAIQDRVLFTGLVSFADLPDYLSIADVAINSLKQSLVANTALPNKVLQYMAAGLPVVSTRLRGLELSFGAGLPGLIFADSPKGVVAESLQLLRGSSELSSLGAENAKIIARMFAQGLAVDSFEELLLELQAGAK